MKTPLLLTALRDSLLLLLLAISPAAFTVHAQTPQYMTYQGYLTDGNGNPLGSTNTGPKAYSVVFRVWSAPTSGTEYYGELQTVTVDNGFFSVLLGQGTAYSSEPHGALASVFANNPASAYIEMTVLGIGASGANVTILPRLQLVSTPYAFVAGSANALVNSSGATLLSSSGSSVFMSQLTVTNLIAPTLSSFTTTNVTAAALTAVTVNTVTLNATNVTAANIGATNVNAGNINAGSIQITNNFSLSGAFSAGALNISGTATLGKISGPTILDMDLGASQNVPSTQVSANNNTYDIRFGGAYSGEGIYCNRVAGSPNAYGISFNTDYTNRMVVANNGNVGIGTTSPNYPLDVETGTTVAFGPYEFMNSGTQGYESGSSGVVPVGIFCAKRMLCAGEYDCVSDARIKEIIGRSDTRDDLATVRKLQITDYRKVDKVQFGGRLEKGVIAQEVESIAPEAVSRSTDFIPNIYAVAQSFDCTNQTLVVTMTKPHGLEVGDQVKFITDNGVLMAGVSAINSPLVFSVGDVSQAPKKLFVFGKQVKDFRSVNYDRLFTTGLGAIQELAKRVDDLDAREARLAGLEQKASQVAALEQEVADLKKMVTQLAEAAKTSKLTAGAAEALPPTLTTASLDH